MLKNKKYAEEISSWDIELFLMSAQLHDVGKIAVADNILSKAEKLTDEEYENVKDHAKHGVEIIRQLKGSVDNEMLLYHAETLAGNHHEKWDGTGYPLGLKGGEIPLQGRLMAIVDVYDALTTDRSHRDKLSHKDAVLIIRNGSGTFFDPGLVKIFLGCEKDFEGVWTA
jgi:putative two-component system response regulator